MESNYWKRRQEEQPRRSWITPMGSRRWRTWPPYVFGKGESTMNYWQKQEAYATWERWAGRRAWRPSVIGEGESRMNYWQRQQARATRRRQAGRRAA
jgi:hypothetical protein